MNVLRNRGLSCGLVAIVMVAPVGCSGAKAVDKAGGDSAVLTLATIDDVNDNGQSFGPQAFVDNLRTVSGGRLKVEIKTDYGDGDAKAESAIVKAIAAGEIDGGWPSTRSFAGAGITSLNAVEAPMTITSYAAEKQLLTAPVAKSLLASLDSTGVVGLGLAVGPLRRPFAAKKPLLGPADWTGARFRTYNSPVQEEAIQALGGTPVNYGLGWDSEVRAGHLRGAEFDIPQSAKLNDSTVAGQVTANVVLWPKVFVLSFSRRRFETLTEQQQGWIREAAERAAKTSVEATYEESTIAGDLCSRGVRFISASPGEVVGLRRKLQPVLDRLAADPKSGPMLKEIQAIATAHPLADVPNVPAACRQTSKEVPVPKPPQEVSALPNGIYRVELTVQDVLAAGLDNSDGNSGTWTLTVRNGTFEGRCRPIDNPGTDCGGTTTDGPLGAGNLRGTGHLVYFVPKGPDQPFRVTWAVAGNSLTFTESSALKGYEMIIEPWQKIG
jgi:TRAP-type C4-dicarboxylate transport system substrate-binding protein